jgi:hypothetical protein
MCIQYFTAELFATGRRARSASDSDFAILLQEGGKKYRVNKEIGKIEE